MARYSEEFGYSIVMKMMPPEPAGRRDGEMAEQIIVSVIVPMYNAERYVAKTLQSVAAQRFDDFEIICVNDGSTDETGRVVEEILASISVPSRIITQRNGGVSSARNRGLEEARGDYVVFLDADDLASATWLKELYLTMREDEADVVFCGFDILDESGTIIREYVDRFSYVERTIDSRGALKLMLQQRVWLWTGAVMYRRNLLDAYGIRFTPGCRYGEDQEFLLKALYHAERVASTCTSLVGYVQRSDSAMGQMTEKRYSAVYALKRLSQYLHSHGVDMETGQLLDGYYIPLTILGVAKDLARGQSEAPDLTYLQRNDFLRQSLAGFRTKGGKGLADKRWWLEIKMVLHCPRFFALVYCRLVGKYASIRVRGKVKTFDAELG